MLNPTTNKAELYRFLSQSPELQLYAIGDLEDYFWSRCRYFAHWENGQIVAVIVVYQTPDLPIVLALGDRTDLLSSMLVELLPTLGERVYAHVSDGCVPAVQSVMRTTYHERQRRMILRQHPQPAAHTEAITVFGPADAERLSNFYQLSYPNNWFDPDMLSQHTFTGYVHHHQLVSVAGIHVYSPTYQVAALGNIATHPDFRGQGFAGQCIAALCEQLLTTVELIGLNVHSENTSAIQCYEKIGFETFADFSEMILERVG